MQDTRISDLHRQETNIEGSATLAGKGPKIKMLQISIPWVLECVRRVPDIRRDKVREMRRRVSSGSWNPQSTRIAEKILYEHLFDPRHS
jgi:hypothetical protein